MFNSLAMAKEWGLTPQQWRRESVDDRAQMMAVVMFDRTIEAYRDWYRKDSKGKGGRDDSSFAKMRERTRLKE